MYEEGVGLCLGPEKCSLRQDSLDGFPLAYEVSRSARLPVSTEVLEILRKRLKENKKKVQEKKLIGLVGFCHILQDT